MDVLDLENKIQDLLVSQPNQEKPTRRRNNKYKDLRRAARQNKAVIPDTVIASILEQNGENTDHMYRTIETMYVTYEKVEIFTGYVNGWYDDIKKIEKEMEAKPNTLRLVNEPTTYSRPYIPEDINEIINYLESCGETVDKEPFYNYESVTIPSERTQVHQTAFKMTIYFFDKDTNQIDSRGSHWQPCYLYEPDLPKGAYPYDDDAIAYVNKYFKNNAPKKRKINKRISRKYTWNPDELFELDKKGLYPDYRKALKERNKSKFWSKTYTQEKGDKTGTKNRLINALNNNQTAIDDLPIDMDKELLDYEFSFYQDVKLYVW